ncbi:MAG: DUF4430 domain-containing protein [Methanomassiliicoccales archaeon]|nr:MAG: DUF4430 domain-containing protein [Methanomassiliicoccales archaeon]
MKLGEMRERYQAILFGSIVVIGVIGLAFAGNYIIGEPVKPNEVENLQISIVGEDWSIDCTMVTTANNTVYRLLLECSEMYGFEVEGTIWQPYDAVFVDSINGLENGEGNWWQYYVNGKYGEISSDRKELFDGDRVEWRCEPPRT